MEGPRRPVNLRHPPKPGDHWRINFSRVEWLCNIADGAYTKVPRLREDNWVWSPQGAIDMHQPEHWGIVQFAPTSDASPQQFRRPADWPARAGLMRIYHAQRAFRAKNNRWATSLDELSSLLTPPLPAQATFALSANGGSYEATAQVNLSEGTRVWSVSPDSRLGRKP